MLLEIVHVIWNVTNTAPPMMASSCRTSLSVMEHPLFRICVRGSNEHRNIPRHLTGRSRTTCVCRKCLPPLKSDKVKIP